MRIPRLIARIDIRNSDLIKGYQMEGVSRIGDPRPFIESYVTNGIDEILVMDSVASLYGRGPNIDLLDSMLSHVSVPVTFGGGIDSLSTCKQVLSAPVDRVAVNTNFFGDLGEASRYAENLGSQSVIWSIEALRRGEDYFTVTSGRFDTGFKLEEVLDMASRIGVGEVLITAVDKDGTCSGADLDLVRRTLSCTHLPLLYSGGIGTLNHIDELIDYDVAAIVIGAAFHFGKLDVVSAKKQLVRHFE